MRIAEIIEAISFGKINDNQFDILYLEKEAKLNSVKVSDINNHLSLYKNNQYLSLFKNTDTLIGLIKLSTRIIYKEKYSHIDIIYIVPEFRHTSAIKWLIYSVKETNNMPVIADGTIFKDGEDLILSLIRHSASLVSALDKTTGQTTKITAPINDTNLCYLFEANRLGFKIECLNNMYIGTALFEDC